MTVAEVERRFNPSQKRDGHGRWSKQAWASESVTVGGHRIDVDAIHDPASKARFGDERQVRFTVHTPDGPRVTTLDSYSAFNLAESLRNPPQQLRKQALHHVRGVAGERTARETGFVGVRRLGDDTFQVNFGGGDGAGEAEIHASIEGAGAELSRLSGAALRASTAATVNTKAGTVGIRALRDGRVEADLPATAGEPIQLNLRREEITDLRQELRHLLDALGEEVLVGAKDGDPESGRYQPRVFGQDELTGAVPLSTTTLFFAVTGKRGKATVKVRSTAHDTWELDLSHEDAAALADTLDDDIDLPSLREEDLARYDEHQLRGEHGRWADMPGVSLDEYADLYDVYDESPTSSGLLAATMSNGEMQLAFDDPAHQDRRQVLLDLDEHDMLNVRQAVQHVMRTGDEQELADNGDVWLRVSDNGGGIDVDVPGEQFGLALDNNEAEELLGALDDQLDRVDEVTGGLMPTAADLQPETMARYNPHQLRGSGGKWTDGGVPDVSDSFESFADYLGLDGRVELRPHERLGSTGDVTDADEGLAVNYAVIHEHDDEANPDDLAATAWIGITPAHDSNDWLPDRGVDNTTHLNVDEVHDLRTGIASAATEADAAATKAEKAWSKGAAPTDPKLRGEEPIATGGDPEAVSWDIYLTDDEPTSWQLTVRVPSGGVDPSESDGISYNPSDAKNLLLHLARIEQEMHGPAPTAVDLAERSRIGRARSPENGPAPSSAAPAGGQFALGGGRVGAKGKSKSAPRRRKSNGAAQSAAGARKPAAPDPNLSFDGKMGTGYGVKGGDPRVRQLQALANHLGVTDLHDQALAVDGRYGPRTTSVVKKLQKALGVPVDGKVTPEFMRQLAGLKQLPPKPPRKRTAAVKAAPAKRRQNVPTSTGSSTTRQDSPARRSRILATVATALGEHRVVDGVCAACSAPTT